MNTDNYFIMSSLDVLACARDSQGRNRSLDVERLKEDLDPLGISILIVVMIHNEVEYRTRMLLKVNDEDDPVEVYCDISFEMMDFIRDSQTKYEFLRKRVEKMNEKGSGNGV